MANHDFHTWHVVYVQVYVQDYLTIHVLNGMSIHIFIMLKISIKWPTNIGWTYRVLLYTKERINVIRIHPLDKLCPLGETIVSRRRWIIRSSTFHKNSQKASNTLPTLLNVSCIRVRIFFQKIQKVT